MKKIALLVAAAVLFGATGAMGGPGDPAPVKDADLGLSKTSVFDVPNPPAVREDETEPGDTPVRPRAYEGAPPLIPHGIADFLPITLEENACLDCHTDDGDAKPVPPSHKTDLRRSPEKAGTGMVGARHICVSCHVPQTDTQPLVENRF